MGEIKVTVPDGKKAEWKDLNGVTVLTLVDADNNQQSEYVPDPRPVTERIKTFEDACDDLNRRAQAGDKLANDLMTDLQFNSPRTPDLLAYIQLRIITYALNEGWVPQFTEDEYRYYPYFYLYTQKEIDDMSEDDKAQLLSSGVARMTVRDAVFRLRTRLAVSRTRSRTSSLAWPSNRANSRNTLVISSAKSTLHYCSNPFKSNQVSSIAWRFNRDMKYKHGVPPFSAGTISQNIILF